MPWSGRSLSPILGPAGTIHRESGRRCIRHNLSILDHSNRCRGRYGGAVHALRDGSVSELHAHEGRVFAGVTSVPERRASWSRIGSIPAWAGEPQRRLSAKSTTRVYPRVGGGTGQSGVQALLYVGLSPRGRGNRDLSQWIEKTDGSIPAWAGEPTTSPGITCSRRVYPRVGGGTADDLTKTDTTPGLSPRGRGNRYAAA